MQTAKNLLQNKPKATQVVIDPEAIAVERLLYTWAVKYDSQPPFEFEHREHAECLAEALRVRNRKSLPLEDVLSLRLPLKPQGCKNLLRMLQKTRQEALKIGDEIASIDNELNELVYQMYGISSDEQAVIEGFLQRYSSVSADSSIELSEDSDDE